MTKTYTTKEALFTAIREATAKGQFFKIENYYQGGTQDRSGYTMEIIGEKTPVEPEPKKLFGIWSYYGGWCLLGQFPKFESELEAVCHMNRYAKRLYPNALLSVRPVDF